MNVIQVFLITIVKGYKHKIAIKLKFQNVAERNNWTILFVSNIKNKTFYN